MNRTVSRKVVFTADEIKEALIQFLEKNSCQAPLASDDAAKFELNEDGATMEWIDATDVTLC